MSELIIDEYNIPFDETYKALDGDGTHFFKEIIKRDNEALPLICNSIDEDIFPRISVGTFSK